MQLEISARWALVTLAFIAVFTALRLTADIFAPLALGLVLGVVLSPISTWLSRIGTPRVVGALAVMVFALVVLAGILLFIGPIVSRLLVQAPQIWREILDSVREFQGVLRGISDASEEVAKAIGSEPNGDAAEPTRVPSLTDALFAAPAFAAQLLIFVGTLFFFVLSREEIYDWITDRLTASHDIMELRLEEADRLVSRYFLTISVINIFFGAAVAAAMALIGMPAPLLWGVVATLMNFILYLGPAVVAFTLFVAGIVVFDGPQVLAPMAAFVALNITEGQFVTPMLVGRHMSVNPLLVFLSLVFWLWLWGPLGGVIAIPILIWCLAITGQLGQPETDLRLRRWTGRQRPER